MTWRIPGLSDKFIEFNDDLILSAPVLPSDLFTKDGVVCYASKKSVWFTTLTRLLKRRKDGTKEVSYKETMLNGAALVGKSRYFLKMDHTPKALLRGVYEEFFTAHPEVLQRNISHRFRHASQFNPQEMHNLSLYRQGRAELRSVKGNLFYLKPKRGVDYIAEKLQRWSQNKGCKFACFNSIDQASAEGQEMIIKAICNRISIEKN